MRGGEEGNPEPQRKDVQTAAQAADGYFGAFIAADSSYLWQLSFLGCHCCVG